MSIRRLIAMIGGRATAGEPVQIGPLAAQPQVVRALRRAILVVGAAGLCAAGTSQLGGGLVDAAASAAVTAGGRYGEGAPAAVVADLAASPVELAELSGSGEGPSALPGAGSAVAAPPETTTTTAPAPPPAPPARAVVAATPTAVAPPAPPAPPPAPPAPGSVEAVISEVFGPHARAAIGVARCESHLNPAAVSRNGANWGLFQINRAHRARVAAMGYAWEDLLDARVNALVARSIFDEQGWRPWACRGAAR